MVLEGGAGLAARADRITPPRHAHMATMRPAATHIRPGARPRTRRAELPFSVHFIWLTSPWFGCSDGVSRTAFGEMRRRCNDSKGAEGIAHAFENFRSRPAPTAASTCGERPGIYHTVGRHGQVLPAVQFVGTGRRRRSA